MDVTEGWGNFLLATAGAAGALAGLLFVALSINLKRILELPGVTGRAAESILLLASALIGSLLGLMPGLSAHGLGICLLALWVPTWGLPTVMQALALRQRRYYKLHHMAVRCVVHQIATAPLAVAGLLLAEQAAGGMRWFAASLLAFLTVAIINAWVLLVEIVR